MEQEEREKLEEEKKKVAEMVSKSKKKLEQKEKEIADMYAREYETLLKDLKTKLEEKEDENIKLQNLVKESAGWKESWENEIKRLERWLANVEQEKKDLERSKTAYQLLLKVVCVTGFVKNFLVRKRLRQVHSKAVELTTQSLVEQASHTPRLDQTVQLENPYDLTIRTSKLKNSWPWNKKAQAPIQAMVISLDSEMAQLQSSISEVRRQKRHWRETADSFFQRNIELTNQFLSHDKSLKEALEKAGTHKTQRKRRTMPK